MSPDHQRRIIVGAPRLIRLQHCKFRRVRGISTFIAKNSIEFENSLESADDASLQKQFGAIRRVEVRIQGVGMGDEWRAAAPPASVCSIGSRLRGIPGVQARFGRHGPQRCAAGPPTGPAGARSDRRSAGGPEPPRSSPCAPLARTQCLGGHLPESANTDSSPLRELITSP